jgi:transcriptional regulator with XRE-family HTH domain
VTLRHLAKRKTRVKRILRIRPSHYAILRYGVCVPTRGRSLPPGELGAELRRLRERAGRTAAALAAEVGWAESTLSRKENGRIGISEKDLDLLMTALAVSDRERNRLSDLARHVNRPRSSRPRTHRAAVPDVYESYMALEEIADEIFAYSNMMVPSLLQIPEYAAAIIQSTPVPEEEFIQERVATRMFRQAVLGRTPPPRLHVILDQSILLRRIGDWHTMRRQMLRLVEASERPNTVIQVLPLDTGAHPGLSGHFTVLRFDERQLPRVFCDGLTGGVLRGDPEEVQRYLACFEKLTSIALDPSLSVTLFQEAANRERELDDAG